MQSTMSKQIEDAQGERKANRDGHGHLCSGPLSWLDANSHT